MAKPQTPPAKPTTAPDRLKGRPSFPFETIALAVAFSPKLEAILTEAKHLADSFKARLLLIHIGKHDSDKEATLQELCGNLGIDREVKTIWGAGDPVTALLETCKRHTVDLLILGARRRETMFRYYLGSVARGLCRRAKCSLLLLTEPRVAGTAFRRLVVDCVDHPKTPHTLNTAWYFSDRVDTREMRLVKEVDQTGLAMAMSDDSTTGERTQVREQLLLEANEQLRLLTADRASEKPKVVTAVLSGRPGFTIRKYAEDCLSDLLIIHSPDSSYGLMDRIFTHDMEYILEQLPGNVLIVHARIGDGG